MNTPPNFMLRLLFLACFLNCQVIIAKQVNDCTKEVTVEIQSAIDLAYESKISESKRIFLRLFDRFDTDSIRCISDSVKIWAYTHAGSAVFFRNLDTSTNLLLQALEIFENTKEPISADLEVQLFVRLANVGGGFNQSEAIIQKRKTYFDRAFASANKGPVNAMTILQLNLHYCVMYLAKLYPTPHNEIVERLQKLQKTLTNIDPGYGAIKVLFYQAFITHISYLKQDHLLLTYYQLLLDEYKKNTHAYRAVDIGIQGYMAALAANDMHEYDKALNFISDTEFCFRKMGLNRHPQQVYLNCIKSEILMNQGELEQALSIVDSTYGWYTFSDNINQHVLSELYQTRFMILFETEEFEEAIQMGLEAKHYTKNFNQERLSRSKLQLQESNFLLGKAYLALGRYEEAIDQFAGIRYVPSSYSSESQFQASKILLSTAELRSGCQECAEKTKQEILKTPDEINDLPYKKFDVRFLHTKLLFEIFDTTQNESYLIEAFESVQNLNVSNIAEMLLIEGMSNPFVFEELLDFCEYILRKDQEYQRLSDEQKYGLIDNIRGFELHNESLFNLYGPDGRATPQLLDERRRLKKAVFNCNQLYSNSIDNHKRDSLFPILRNAENDLEGFERDHLGKVGRSFEIVPQQNSLSVLQSNLPEHTQLLEYFVGKENLFATAISRHSFVLKKLDLRFAENSVHKYLELIQNIRTDVDSLSEYSSLIYKQLIEPFNLPESSDRMIIIPDGFLNRLPFETLRDQPGNYLVENHSIQYHLSAQLCIPSESGRRKKNSDLVAFSPSYEFEDKSKLTVRGILKSGAIDRYPNLPGARNEAKEICSIWEGELFSNGDVTRLNFQKYGADANILHLAMHAKLDEEKIHNSALILGNDEEITFGELSSMCFNTRLVTLSACNTGVGNIKSGYGVKSLARGFLSNGVPSVVMSLWEVPDHATEKIMIEFYRGLKEGLRKDQALQQAKLHYLHNCENPQLRHPLYWAGFVSFGDASPVIHSGPGIFILLLSAMLIFFILFGLVKIMRGISNRMK